MTIVVDASVALKWVLEEPGSDAAEELLEKDLAAPSLWLLEAGNALWRRAFRGELTQADAVERLTALTKAPVASVPLEQDAWGPMSSPPTPGSARRWLTMTRMSGTFGSCRR